MTKIEEIEGIGDKSAEKLKAMGIGSCEALLQKGGSPSGRDEIAKQTGMSGKHILRWVNHADLFRIKGVAGQFAELLEAAGVDSVVELARRSPENLCAALAQANAQKKLCKTNPDLARVSAWISEAKTLPRAVMH